MNGEEFKMRDLLLLYGVALWKRSEFLDLLLVLLTVRVGFQGLLACPRCLYENGERHRSGPEGSHRHLFRNQLQPIGESCVLTKRSSSE